MKKIAFLLIFTVIFSFASVTFAENSVLVSLSDNYIGHSTSYTISFAPETNVKNGESISITFDESIPILRNPDKTREITINGTKIMENAKFFGHKIRIASPIEINRNSRIVIFIPQGIIQNPSFPKYCILSVKIGDSTYKSNYYKITDKSTIKDVKFKQAADGMEITFTTGFNGSLKGYKVKTVRKGPFTFSVPVPQDFIFIRFSHTLSESFSSIPKNDITVNGTNPPINPTVKTHFKDTKNEEKEIAICVPKKINEGSNVKIFIKGIGAPDTVTGVLYVKVWTSKEITPIKSNVSEIRSRYFIKTDCAILPENPDGKNGFYKTKPIVTLKTEKGAEIGKIDTFYSFDGKNFTQYTKPIRIGNGTTSLYYYSTGYSGKRKFVESVHYTTFKVDSTPPVITVKSAPLTSKSPIYNLQITISDKNFDYATVVVYGITFTFTERDISLPVYLFENETNFTVNAFDRAGNLAQFKGKILLDKN